ncbi:hypothetical protein PJ985_12260 [Streptomyces sp. ACA25]|uniref:ABC transporter permease n=1 Tax=Streptomyces sp. ACA25 TaxID=3022596 RepID=UPI0023080EEF|nr:hypothetical protein [Streptomyces sp. ACA25]MDB1088339.1 hypothetical protein [Streptomyces sp. ACA25]
MAVGDFRDRARRPVYLVTLLATVGLGYLAVPDSAHWTIVQIGAYRGEYDSAYVGMVTALAGALWLTVGGFYVVRDTIARDETTGVGQLLAATPLRTTHYLAGKFLSNLLVLASMAGVLAGTALVMQLARGENRAVDPYALLMPYAVFALPLLAMTAAAAVLFAATPVLRGGVGNVVWFVVALIVAIGGQSASAPLDGLGVHRFAESLRAALTAQHPDASTTDFSLGLTYLDDPLIPFTWDGFHPGGGFLLTRLLLVALAIAVALLPALWFGRFDPSRARHRGGVPVTSPVDTEGGPAGGGGAVPAAVPAAGPATTMTVSRLRTDVAAGSTPGSGMLRLLSGELRILVQGLSPWWWAVVAALTLAALTLPVDTVVGVVLPMCWVWPVLVWSRLGTQQVEYGLESLLGAYPRPRPRLVAQWAAGSVLTAVTGAGPLVRMVIDGDTAGVAAWCAAVLFIPAFALSLGTVSRSHRLFQALYLPLWYIAVNGIPALDFMGAVRTDGQPAGPHPAFVAACALALLATALLAGSARRAVKE